MVNYDVLIKRVNKTFAQYDIFIEEVLACTASSISVSMSYKGTRGQLDYDEGVGDFADIKATPQELAGAEGAVAWLFALITEQRTIRYKLRAYVNVFDALSTALLMLGAAVTINIVLNLLGITTWQVDILLTVFVVATIVSLIKGKTSKRT